MYRIALDRMETTNSGSIGTTNGATKSRKSSNDHAKEDQERQQEERKEPTIETPRKHRGLRMSRSVSTRNLQQANALCSDPPSEKELRKEELRSFFTSDSQQAPTILKLQQQREECRPRKTHPKKRTRQLSASSSCPGALSSTTVAPSAARNCGMLLNANWEPLELSMDTSTRDSKPAAKRPAAKKQGVKTSSTPTGTAKVDQEESNGNQAYRSYEMVLPDLHNAGLLPTPKSDGKQKKVDDYNYDVFCCDPLQCPPRLPSPKESIKIAQSSLEEKNTWGWYA